MRIIRACRDMGLVPVAVYSACDRAARHVRMADEAIAIGPSAPADSYLRIDRLIAAAHAAGADAVHPGYGFLAENDQFATACRDAGLTFVGPTAAAIRLMGSKTAARQSALRAGVPVVPGSDEPIGADVPDAAIAEIAERLGYPVLVTAVAGGGGWGVRVVTAAGELGGGGRAARSEAHAAFGDAAVYLERRLVGPRHIEVQVLGDHYGTVLPFVERECSIQRRHQKVIEETPSPAVSRELRARLTAAAAAVAASVGYTNAGTVEFLVDEDGRFSFLEMNTRLQVEHPVTEVVTGVDLVQWQLRIARGERLDLAPAELLTPRGHALECRISAEDPDAGFLPCPGRVTSLRVPAGPGIRDDSGVDEGGEVPSFYDPLMFKLVAWGGDRPQAIARMRRALREYEILGVRTTVPFFRWWLEQPAFVAGQFHTGSLDELLHERRGRPFSEAEASVDEVAAVAAALLPLAAPGPLGHRHSTGLPSARSTHDRGAANGGWTSRARQEGLRG